MFHVKQARKPNKIELRSDVKAEACLTTDSGVVSRETDQNNINPMDRQGGLSYFAVRLR